MNERAKNIAQWWADDGLRKSATDYAQTIAERLHETTPSGTGGQSPLGGLEAVPLSGVDLASAVECMACVREVLNDGHRPSPRAPLLWIGHKATALDVLTWCALTNSNTERTLFEASAYQPRQSQVDAFMRRWRPGSGGSHTLH